MYRNLKTAMAIKRVTNKALGELIEAAEKTVYNKLEGVSDWTYPEVLKIKKFLFPEYDLDWLFAIDKKSA